MKKQIFLPAKAKTQLQKDFNTTRPTVWSALNFLTDSSFARTIRAAAIERGGVIYGGLNPIQRLEEYVPNCETSFDEVHHEMIQVFSSRVKLIIKFTTGVIEYWIDNNLSCSYENLTILETNRVQCEAEEMAKSLIMINNYGE